MEPNENIYCYQNSKEKCQNKKNCLEIVAVILLTTFALVLGLLIGASLASVITSSLAAIIVLAIVLGLLLVLTVILILCNKRIKKKSKCNCC